MRACLTLLLSLLASTAAFGQTSSFCAATNNSTGSPAVISTTGSLDVSQNNFGLSCSQLPASTIGVFVMSDQSAAAAPPNPGSMGNLCLGGARAVFSGNILSTGSAGSVSMPVDLTNLPLGGGSAAAPGETYFFQFWFRDIAPAGASNNLSDGVEVTFDPLPPSFSTDIYDAIFDPGCFGCHGNSGGLTLSGGSQSAYNNLVNAATSAANSGGTCAPLRVDPFNASGSLLVQVLESGCSNVSQNMWPNGSSASFQQASVATIRAWIDAGAPNN